MPGSARRSGNTLPACHVATKRWSLRGTLEFTHTATYLQCLLTDG